MAKRKRATADSTEAAAAARRQRRERAERIADADPPGVLTTALRIDVVRALAESGAPATLVGALVQAGSAPKAWFGLPVWERDPSGVLAVVPRGAVDVDDRNKSLLLRAGDPEWTGARLSGRACTLDMVLDSEHATSRRPLANVMVEWLRTTPVEGRLSALTLVVETMPCTVAPETRLDRRILPRVEIRDHPERVAGRLFGGLHGGRERGPQLTLPLWPNVPPVKRVAVLDMMDAAGLPVMARGRGAPLAARLHVRVLATVRPEDRASVVRLALTAEELRRGLFGARYVKRQWEQLRDALMHARDYAIHDGSGLWFPVALRRLPTAWDPAGEVVIDVDYPPGSTSGPEVSLPDMDRLALQSGPRWRAYIAAHSLAWRPGATRVRTTGGRFAWSRDAGRYLVLTRADRRRFAFGADKKHRTRAEIDGAFVDLPGLRVVSREWVNPRTGEVGWLVVPAAAALAIGRNRGGSNRGI